MKNGGFTFAVGMLTGAVLFSGVTAYAAGVIAEYAPQRAYVDGAPVQLEAYNIDGNNYVKLRDIGEAVGFNVYWDGSAIRINSGTPYTGLSPTLPVQSAQSISDYSRQANPAVFSGELTREVYNAVRDTILNQDAIIAGSREPVSITGSVERNGAVDSALIAIGRYPIYELDSRSGQYVCNARYPEAYDAPAAYTRSFVDGLAGLSQREKVRQITWYVCDRITYSLAYPSPSTVLTGDVEVPGCCMAYAYSFQFLCNRAGIPCLLVNSGVHQWNMVYVDGQWWDVDATATDCAPPDRRENCRVLTPPSERFGSDLTDSEPDVTRFAQELLVPGSTK